MKRTAKRRSPCPVSCTLDLLGDRWTLLVIRDLFCGKTHFKDFCQSPEGIATNTLSDRLDRLLNQGLVETFPSPVHAGRSAYRLTEKGSSLYSVLEVISDWGLANLDGTAALLQPNASPALEP